MKNLLLVSMCLVFAFGCKKKETDSAADIQENAQQIGDVMASIDESGGSSGDLAQIQVEDALKKSFDRFAPGEGAINKSTFAAMFLQSAEATACFSGSANNGFGSCTGSAPYKKVRNFNNCTIGAAVLSGDVTVTWASASATGCAVTAAGQTITRSPNFTLTGLRGATLAVTKSGSYGQGLTLQSSPPLTSSSIFFFGSDGINRKFTTGTGTVLFDQTTTTSGTLKVTGNARGSRVIDSNSGGSLKVVNNLTAVTCNYTPSGVTWDRSTCNCPTQGSWSGSCSDGKSATLNITGCGTGTFTDGTDTTDVTFDRCASN